MSRENRGAKAALILADGAIHPCFIIDMSATGAAVSAELQPEVGTPLAVGTCVGRVTRIFAGGFAVKFVEKLNQNDLDRFIARPIIGSASGAAKAAFEPDDSLVEKVDA